MITPSFYFQILYCHIRLLWYKFEKDIFSVNISLRRFKILAQVSLHEKFQGELSHCPGRLDPCFKGTIFEIKSKSSVNRHDNKHNYKNA